MNYGSKEIATAAIHMAMTKDREEEKLLKAIQKSDLEEVKIFEKEFLPSFHKTLDQMKK